MNPRLAVSLAVNLVFVNGVVFFFELAARTFSPSHHALVSAGVTIAFVGALVLCERFEARPLVGALLVALGPVVGWVALERNVLPIVPLVFIAAPLVFIDARLLRWVGRAPAVDALIKLVVGAFLLASVVVLLDRRGSAGTDAGWASNEALFSKHVRVLG
jgi:hypothetical protein